MLFSVSISSAQVRNIVIQEAEFFWDVDPGEGLATQFSVLDGNFNQAVELLFEVNINIPQQGVHIFNIRVKDEDGNWGSIFSKAVMVNPATPERIIQIQEGEYFWDVDPGEGLANTILAFDGNFDNAVEQLFESNLILPGDGNHTFNIRVKDEDDIWGSTFSKVVLVHAAVELRDIIIQEAEYFWNNDPGEGLANTVIAFDGNFDKAVEELFVQGVNLPSDGINVFNIRVKDEDGNWGSVFSKAVMVNPATVQRLIQIQEGEYFWDADPGEGLANTILAFDGSFDNAVEQIFDNIDSGVQQGFPNAGFHIFNIRLKDEDGIWGSTFKQLVRIRSWLVSQAVTNNNEICIGDSVQLEMLGGLNYTWSPPTGLDTTEGSIVNASPNETTNYMVIGTGEDNYIDTTYYTLTVLNTPNIEISSINNPNCNNCNDGSISIAISADENYNVLWTSNNFQSDEENISELAIGEYILTVTNENGCSWSETIILQSNDFDDDGINNEEDLCPYNPDPNCSCTSDIDNDNICDQDDTDIDGDGINNEVDLCPYNSDPNCNCESDLDNDNICDQDDVDIDNDGLNNNEDACPYNSDLNCDCDSDVDECGVCNGNGPQFICINGEIVCNEEDCVQELGCNDLNACNYCQECVADNTLCTYPNQCGDCDNIEFSQSINLPDGWSYFSTYICPLSGDFEELLIDLIDNNSLIILKDEDGNVFWPLYDINTIGDLTTGKAYLIKLENTDILNVYGGIIDYNYPINLNTGWSYIGYLHQSNYPVTDMAIPAENNLIIIKDSDGNVYWPYYNINTIGLMNPGEGYQIKLENEMVFSYPDADNGRYTQDNDMPMYSSRFDEIKNTGNNMTIGIPEKAWETKPNINDEILVYDQNLQLVGKNKYREDFTALTIWGNDQLTKEKDGLDIGEVFIFNLFRFENETIETLQVNKWEQGDGWYQSNGISIVESISKNIEDRKKLIKVTDIIGREIDSNSKNTVLIFIYDDGSCERQIILK